MKSGKFSSRIIISILGVLVLGIILSGYGGGTGHVNVYTEVAAGTFHTLAIRDDGTLWAWGYNLQGQLGDGTYTQRNTPVQVGADMDWVDVAAGGLHSLALKSDGTIWAWGYNGKGQLGDGTITNRNSPVQVSGGWTNVTAISAGWYHSLAVRDLDADAIGDSVYAWGQNNLGQLGDGTTTQRTTPVQVKGVGGTGFLTGNGITAVAGGGYHSIALGTYVYTWGSSSNGQLGDGTIGKKTVPTRVKYLNALLTGMSSIAAGGNHSLAIKTSDGSIFAWGANNYGQLGDGTVTQRTTAVKVKDSKGFLTTATAIASKANHSAALTSAGLVYTWGYNAFGQLGDNTSASRIIPVKVKGKYGFSNIASVDAIACGQNFTCALKSDGSIWSAGENRYGALGNSLTTNSRSIVLAGITSIVGGQLHAIALKNDGTAWAWGENSAGQLGDANAPNNSNVPVQTAGGLSDVIAIAAGVVHSLALKNDGTVKAWGDNSWNQSGTGSSLPALPFPVSVLKLTKVTAITAGGAHSAAVSAGFVYTWGGNTDGQLALSPVTYPTKSIPTKVSNLSNVLTVAAGDLHTMVLKSDGTVWSWGNNDQGQLGNGTNTDSITPVRVSGLATVVAISAGSDYSVALKSDGTVWTWGANDNNTPAQVAGLTGVTAIAAGPTHILALKSDGTVWAWGSNTAGQLGDGTNNDSATPVQVVGPGGAGNLTNITAIAGGGADGNSSHSIALKDDGTFWAWGFNGSGQLGDMTNNDSNVPVAVTAF